MILRLEEKRDYFAVENLHREAFWDLHVPGCNEHLLAHKMRNSPDFLPELCYVAEVDGQVVGSIMYTRAWVEKDGERTDILCFGPLGVLPEYHKKGIGSALVKKTVSLARDMGERAVLILGEPEYYPRFGFKTSDHYGITTADGKNFDAFMALELYPGALEGITGRFLYSPIYEDLPEAEFEEFDKLFPPKEKHVLPTQWQQQ